MTHNHSLSGSVGWLALATGGVAVFAVVAIALMFIVGGVFGLLNDIANGAEACLTAALAWMLHPWLRSQFARLGAFASLSAGGGALVAVAGSALIIFDFTGWYLAGLYTMFGYALIGLWLLGLNVAALQSDRWPRRLAGLGVVAGAAMAAGFLAGPGILSGVDDPGAARWFVNAGMLGSLGWMFLYPIWCVWLGRTLVLSSATMRMATHA